MATHLLIVEGWQPTALNRLVGNWRRAARLKRHDRIILAPYGLLFPHATGRRRVSLTVTLAPRQRAPDPDSLWKSTLDALVAARLLRDDNRQGVELGPVTFQRGGSKSTTIHLEDLP